MPGSIIVFSGMDGAGKSTQIELLHERLVRDGQSTQLLWSRGGYTPGINQVKSILRRATRHRAVPIAGPSADRTRAFSRTWVRRLWLQLAMLDLIFLYGFWLRCQRWLGRTTICDRYLADTRLDFSINFPKETVEQWWLWTMLTWVTPRPNASFLMLISAEESQRRSLLKHEPFPDSAETLSRRLAEYETWSDEYLRLDGLRPALEIADEIYDFVSDVPYYESKMTISS